MTWTILPALLLFIGFGLAILPAFRHDRALKELESMAHNHAPADELQYFTDNPQGES